MTTSILQARFSSHPHRSQAQGVDVIAETAPLRLIAFAPLAGGLLPRPACGALGQKARCEVLPRAGCPQQRRVKDDQLSSRVKETSTLEWKGPFFSCLYDYESLAKPLRSGETVRLEIPSENLLHRGGYPNKNAVSFSLM
jgi:hypothetical protein